MDEYYFSDHKKERKIYEDAQERTWLHEVFDWLDAVVISVIIVVMLFSFVFRIVGIHGPSMEDTLIEGDRVIVSDMFYEPKQGDIVVISRNYTNDSTIALTSQNEPIIKRIIAVSGQTVNIDFENGIVYVDGKAMEEPYAKTPTTNMADIHFPLRVKDGTVFVLGDNRLESMDSRYSEIGLVDTRYILGQAVFRVYPFNQIGSLN